MREQQQDDARRRGGNERAVGQKFDAKEVQVEQRYESQEERVDVEAQVGTEKERSNGSGSAVVGFALPVLCPLILQVRVEMEPKMAICEASREYSAYMRVERLTLSLLSSKASGRRLT